MRLYESQFERGPLVIICIVFRFVHLLSNFKYKPKNTQFETIRKILEPINK